MVDKIMDILKQGEGIKIEFKESKNKINRDLYESICALSMEKLTLDMSHRS